MGETQDNEISNSQTSNLLRLRRRLHLPGGKMAELNFVAQVGKRAGRHAAVKFKKKVALYKKQNASSKGSSPKFPHDSDNEKEIPMRTYTCTNI
ncbi:hypothetical protein BaRGS_00034953 [Batillaria attramentaria]|uniref:Uncharacterized protein n=1 Tax=Batillaria attramentaria TaxID=370345 RepID=A0ABD0JG29_9CAEN